MVQIAFSQTITLNFTGATNHREYVQLDSVRVENISRSWEETLVYPDTILMLADETGIDEIANNALSCISYPNPFNGTSHIELTLSQDEQLSLRVYNLVGQLVMEKHLQVEAGKSHFEISLTHPQVYFLVAQTIHGQMVQKLINTGSSGGNDITYKGTFSETASVKIQKLLSSKSFRTGDVLRITGFTTHYGMVVSSDEILQPQSASENFTLFFTLQNYTLPTLTTIVASQITDTSAVSGGIITDDGGIEITARGVCWDTIPNPTISNNHTTDGLDTGSFTSHLTGLAAGTTYYVRAYATNAVGTAYGNRITFTTNTIPTIKTTTASNITDSSAVSGGNITSDGGTTIIARGVCWDTIPNPTISNNHTTDGLDTGSFTSHLTGLTARTTYYVRAYATNAVGTAYGNEETFLTTANPIDMRFSVSPYYYQKVFFSPGNLQWSATNGGNTATTHAVAGNGTAAGTWRFATNQWDMTGTNGSISATYTGWIDLFGWGTSGYNNKYPYMTSTTNQDYGNGSHIAGTNYDWGVYNAIYNPKTQTTDAPGTWRTLTKDEWVYLLNSRPTASSIRYAKAIVNGVNGLIIVPDNWITSIYSLNNTNNPNAAHSSNIIGATDWAKMEAAGCVFLPAAGYRMETSEYNFNSGGSYWSTTYYDRDNAYYMYFGSNVVGNYLNPSAYSDCYYGRSVRLVKDDW